MTNDDILYLTELIVLLGMKQKSKVRENSEYAKSACISTVFPFGVLAPDGRARGHQWHSRGQRFDPAYLHQKTLDFT